MPLKQAILPLLDELDPAAAACGAVNTVCFRRGRAVGYNTDAPGIRAGLLAHGADPRAGQVLIIGNGGAARAARFALGDCRLLTAARHGDEADGGQDEGHWRLRSGISFSSPGSGSLHNSGMTIGIAPGRPAALMAAVS